MSNEIARSPSYAVNKTRNAILRLKKSSPELRTVLRQRCQDRISNDRLKILNKLRKIRFRAFAELPAYVSPEEFNLDDELLLEELLEKELLSEQEDWLLQQYEELLGEELKESREVVCPLCCSGYLEKTNCHDCSMIICTKCPANFVIEKCLLDLQAAIYECLGWHDKQCDYNPNFVTIHKNENENNLCIVCHHCSFLNVIV